MLFQGVTAGQPAAPIQPRIMTPFGEVITYATATTLDTTRATPDEQLLLPSGTEWRRWSTDEAVVEVLMGPYVPVLPSHMRVQASVAVVWRVQARQALFTPTLCCRLDVLPDDADGGANSGEGLDAQTWRMPGTTLSMGTEDGEFLAVRAAKGEFVPARFKPELHFGTVLYMDGGLQVPFSRLEAGELVQVQFVLAWADDDDPDRVDTWYAVDQSPVEILRQLGVRNS